MGHGHWVYKRIPRRSNTWNLKNENVTMLGNLGGHKEVPYFGSFGSGVLLAEPYRVVYPKLKAESCSILRTIESPLRALQI